VSQLVSQLETPEETALREVSEKTPSSRRWRMWAALVAFGLLIPVLVLGLVEAGLRIFGVGYPPNLMVPCTVRGNPAACYNLFFAAPFFPPGMIKTPQMYALPAVKPPHTFRIFIIGESAAMGDPDPAFGFGRYLEVMLREQFPDEHFEVVNTGIVAVNSHVLLRVTRELAHYQPDLFIIYAGNNEVVGPYGPGTVLQSSAMSLPVIRSSILLRSSRLGQLAARMTQPKQQWRGMEMFLDKQVPADSLLMEKVYGNFEANLRDMIADARASGARVLVSTVATNLRDCAPFASLHRKNLGEEALNSWSALVQQGAEFENLGRYDEALAQYRRAAAIDDQYAELEFRIARSLWTTGNFADAREHFVRARDLDTLRFRADSKLNGILRSVAASSGDGVKLVDAESVFAKESRGEIIGSELLYEHVHLRPTGNYLLARTLFPGVVTTLPATIRQDRASDEILSETESERRLALTDFDRSRAENDILQRLLKPPFTNQLNNSEEVKKVMARMASAEETPQDAATQYEWAIARNPGDQQLHFDYGLFLYSNNPFAAEEQFAAARPFDGFPVVTPDGRVH
jgi:tetratricopeptide (TPR) repeat protein